MSEEMQTEIEKRIERNCYGYENLEDVLVGAKFILELPELREIREVLEWYATKGEGPYTDSGIWRRAKSALETLKKAGLV